VGWRHAAAALDAGTLTGGSGSDNRVLRIAASLSELGVPVDLADAVTGLDRHNLALVLAALLHGWRCLGSVDGGRHDHAAIGRWWLSYLGGVLSALWARFSLWTRCSSSA